MRYGLLHDPSGLHNIWRTGNPDHDGRTQPLVVAVFAALLTALSIRVFTRKAVELRAGCRPGTRRVANILAAAIP